MPKPLSSAGIAAVPGAHVASPVLGKLRGFGVRRCTGRVSVRGYGSKGLGIFRDIQGFWGLGFRLGGTGGEGLGMFGDVYGYLGLLGFRLSVRGTGVQDFRDVYIGMWFWGLGFRLSVRGVCG